MQNFGDHCTHTEEATEKDYCHQDTKPQRNAKLNGYFDTAAMLNV
jgi:hypothetical protein